MRDLTAQALFLITWERGERKTEQRGGGSQDDILGGSTRNSHVQEHGRTDLLPSAERLRTPGSQSVFPAGAGTLQGLEQGEGPCVPSRARTGVCTAEGTRNPYGEPSAGCGTSQQPVLLARPHPGHLAQAEPAPH